MPDVNPVITPERLRFLRFLTLFCLCFSDGTYTVLRRYSRGVLQENYNVNEVLLMAEIYKVIFSVWMVSTSSQSHKSDVPLTTYLICLVMKSRKMLLLAIIYGVGNVLSYYALARVGAGTFVVFAQGKTLTTALFSSLMLGRSYTWTQWRALLTLVAGVVLFVIPTLQNNNVGDASDASKTSEITKGCLAQSVVIMISGFASIYFEKAIKNDVASEGLDIWARNFQLGFHSIFIYGIMIVAFANNHEGEGEDGIYFANWTLFAFVLSGLGAGGGLLVALSIKYGDSVLKTLAISGSIIYAAIVDRFVLGGPLTGQMSVSAFIVVVAIISYTFDATPKAIGSNQSSLAESLPLEEIVTDATWVDSESQASVVERKKEMQ